MAQRASGLSHIPRPERFAALQRSLAGHYPEQFIGLRPRTSALVDVVLDERGIVRDVKVPDRSGQPATVRKIRVDRVPGSNTDVRREVDSTYDQAFGPAAAAALKGVRFLPGLRNGRPVPFTLRMSVEFVSPGS
jgi:hypothetical protein